MRRDEYLCLRNRYEPEKISLVVVAESPPTSGRYFYNPEGAISEPLFAAFMKQLGSSPTNKDEGLRHLQRTGWVLVDATYEPVNDFSESARDRVILRDYDLLRDGIASLTRNDRTVPIILIKANVCRLLESKLKADGFNVLNGGHIVAFPSHGNQRRFEELFGRMIMSASSPSPVHGQDR